MKFDLELKYHPLGLYFNYHHLIKEWMFPLYKTLSKQGLLDKELTINIEEGKKAQIQADKWDNILEQVFPKITITHKKVDWEKLYISPWGSSESGDHIKEQVLSFRKYVLGILKIKDKKRKVVLIERPNSQENINRPEKFLKTGLKYIKNHKELKDALESNLKDFENVFCENLTFREQVELFYNAKVIIAQHGAALTNIFWMKPGSLVIEYSIGKDFKWPAHVTKVFRLKHVVIDPLEKATFDDDKPVIITVPVEKTLEILKHLK